MTERQRVAFEQQMQLNAVLRRQQVALTQQLAMREAEEARSRVGNNPPSNNPPSTPPRHADAMKTVPAQWQSPGGAEPPPPGTTPPPPPAHSVPVAPVAHSPPAPVPAPPTSAPTSASTPAPAPTAAISKERLVDSLLLYANRSAVEVRAVERYRLGNGLLALELNKRVTHWLPRVTVRRDSDLIHDPA